MDLYEQSWDNLGIHVYSDTSSLRGYCDGAAHQRKDPYRASPFDTALLFLQTRAAATKWPISPRLLQDLQAAMATCLPSAAAAERQRKQRGSADLDLRGLGVPVQRTAAGSGVCSSVKPEPVSFLKKPRAISTQSQQQQPKKKKKQKKKKKKNRK
eukprot:gene12416-12552_t